MFRRHQSLIFPKGTYKTPTFYFRGTDQFKEGETSIAAMRSLQIDLERAIQKQEEAKFEFYQAKEELSSAESYLGQINTKKVVLVDQIEQINSRRKEIESALESVNKEMENYVISISTLESLKSEFENFDIIFMKMSNDKDEIPKEMKETKWKLGQVLKLEEYKFSVFCCAELDTAIKIKELILSKLQVTMNKFNKESVKKFSNEFLELKAHEDRSLAEQFARFNELKLRKIEIKLQKETVIKHYNLIMNYLDEFNEKKK
uniref:SMC domain protein n=1 Tax=Coptotermes formosanus TaxID=36987 RepID=R4V1D8_COPFO|nr:SMC domain protein [Coptotermes formosanus]